jgi:hypothetical protein
MPLYAPKIVPVYAPKIVPVNLSILLRKNSQNGNKRFSSVRWVGGYIVPVTDRHNYIDTLFENCTTVVIMKSLF